MDLPLSRIGLGYLVGLSGRFGLIVLGLLYYIGLDQQTRAPRVADATTAARDAISGIDGSRRSEANSLGNPASPGFARRRDHVAAFSGRLAKFHAEISTNDGASLVQAIDCLAAGTADVSRNITSGAEAAGQTGQTAAQVLESSGEPAKQAERLRMGVERFLANIRAA